MQAEDLAMLRFIAAVLMSCVLSREANASKKDIAQLTIQVQDLRAQLEAYKEQCSDSNPLGGVVQEDGYILASKLFAGIGAKAHNAFTDYERNDDMSFLRDITPSSCRLTGACREHYIGGFGYNWGAFPVQTVKLSLYKNGQQVHYMLFNGTDSSWTDWFSSDRLLESSWPDLNPSSTNMFSVYGDTPRKRRFYIRSANSGNTCDSDAGWLVLKDEADGCPWGSPKGVKYPVILYAAPPNVVKFQSSDVARADSMAVWFKLQGIETPTLPCVG